MLKDTGSNSDSAATKPSGGKRKTKTKRLGGSVRLTESAAALFKFQKQSKLSNVAFAKALGVSTVTLANWRRSGKASKSALIVARSLVAPSPKLHHRSPPVPGVRVVLSLSGDDVEAVPLAGFKAIVLEGIAYRLVPDLI